MNHQYDLDKIKQQSSSNTDEIRIRFEKQILELKNQIEQLKLEKEKNEKNLLGDIKNTESNLRNVF